MSHSTMRGPSVTLGVRPSSTSQHAASRQATLRSRSAGTRGSSANARRPPPSLPTAAAASPSPSGPPRRRNTAEGIGTVELTSRGGGHAHRPPRAESANPARHIDSNPVGAHAGQDVAYLYQQLQDVLQQQSRVEEERQRQLMQYRRQLRAYCDDNATLRNIIQAGEARKRDAAIAVADTVGASSPTSGPLRAHSGGTRKGPASVTEAELDVVEQRIHLARQRHNRLSHDVRVNAALLAKEERARVALTEEAGAPLDPASLLMGANRPVYLRMMRLEHLLNAVLQKQSTVGVVLKNYRYHQKTLRDEATQYDVQQRMLDTEYAERHRDHLQLLELYDTARAAYTTAVDTRVALLQSSAKMRGAKERALLQKRKEVEKELAQTQLQERHAVDLQQQLEEESQLLDAAENTKAQLEKQRLNSRTALTLLKAANTSVGESGGGDGQLADEGADERLSAFEVAFRDMMHIAHADTLDALVDTYQAEMEQQCKLQDDLDDLREARAILQQETQMLRERVKQTKYCVGAGTRFGDVAGVAAAAGSEGGEGGWRGTTAASPLMEREMETFLREEKETLSAQISENERNQSLLIEVAERMNRLAALVADYRSDVRLPAMRLSPALSKRSSTLPLHSAVLAQKLLALASEATPQLSSTTGPGVPALTLSSAAAEKDARHTRGAASMPVVSSTHIIIPANNRRVPLAHERSRRGGDADGTTRAGIGDGGGGGRSRFSADVGGMSSSAARALLNAAEAPPSSANASPDGGVGRSRLQRKRRSTATAGAGFIEGQDADDEAQLATVAALPPPGGRVLDFDLDTSEDSDGRMFSESSSDRLANNNNNHNNGENADGGGEADTSMRSPMNAATRRRRSSAKVNLPGKSGGSGGGNARGQASAAAVAAEDDQEDPLRRDEVKKMSEMIQERRRRDAEEAGKK